MSIRLEYSNICTSENVIHDIIKLEKSIYTSTYLGSFNSLNKLFNKFKEMFVLAYNDTNELIGYLCCFPISDKLYNKIISDTTLHVNNILPEDIMNWDEVNNFYLVAILVSYEYQKQHIATLLMRKFLRKLHVKQNKSNVVNILAPTITDEGECLLKSFGFTLCKDLKSTEGYKLYSLDYTTNKPLIL